MPQTRTRETDVWVERVLGASLPTGSRGDGLGVAFTKARLRWDQTRKQVRSALQTLERSVLDTCVDEPDYDAIAANSHVLYVVLDFLDERLIDTLDEAVNAEPGPARRALRDAAREIVNEYNDYIAADELLRDIDDNGFVEIGIIALLTEALQGIDAELRAAG